MTITASMVKDLRDRTGAGMMDSKKALQETNGNMDEAIDYLRKNGIAKAEKKSGRIASEGMVFTTTEGNKGLVVEVNSETDFVAKNDKFKDFVAKLAAQLLASGETDVDAINAGSWVDGGTVAEALTALTATIGEKIALRRVSTMTVENGVVAGYMHMGGKIGVLVGLEGEATDKLEETAKNIAMHVAAANPQFQDRSSVDADTLAREKAIYEDQARQSGKPEAIMEKIVEGRLNKFCEEICLVDQAFVMDTDRKVGQVVTDAGATLAGYTRFGLGDGIEKKEDNFAEEVAAAVNG